MQDILEKIQIMKTELPKRQRSICDYICDNLFEASTLTIVELAEKTNTGTTTVVRTVQALGYSSYIQFKNDLQKIALGHSNLSFNELLLDHWNSMKDQSGRDGGIKCRVSSMLAEFSAMIGKMDNSEFARMIEDAAGVVLKAKKVYILGLRTSYALALRLQAVLLQGGIEVHDLSARPDWLYDKLIELTPDDLLITVAGFPAVKDSVNALTICKERKIPTLLITNTSETVAYTNAGMIVDTNDDRWGKDSGGSFIGLIAAIEILGQEVGRHTLDTATVRLKEIQGLMETYGVSVWEEGL